MNRIIATIVLTFTMLGALVVPAQAADEPAPAEPGISACRFFFDQYEVRLDYASVVIDQTRAQLAIQRDRAEAFKAQVARKDATIARLREQLAAARR